MVSTESRPLKTYPNCFGCGDDNPIGLRLAYRSEGNRLVTAFTPSDAHQGWPGIVHGGIITTLLYEVMENLPYADGKIALMRRMQTRFRKPARIGERITAAAWFTSQNGRDMSAAATLADARGELIAEGSAELVALRQEHIERLGIA